MGQKRVDILMTYFTVLRRSMVMCMKDHMHTGAFYLPDDEDIMRDQMERLDRLYEFNMTRPTEMDKRKKSAERNVC